MYQSDSTDFETVETVWTMTEMGMIVISSVAFLAVVFEET
jgi:hypothetical protein